MYFNCVLLIASSCGHWCNTDDMMIKYIVGISLYRRYLFFLFIVDDLCSVIYLLLFVII